MDLKFDKVSKRYRVRQETVDSSSHPLVRKLQSFRKPVKDFWALRDLSFEVERGESLGIIGHNGAGKSTILKLLANITAPTSGEITINGRLSALIEVGSGFHPELTGRENIYLNGSILGMRRREITEKLDSIVDFAGVRQFLDTPVKRFSSGMYVRLGFSIAAHLDPDILLLDEVLAVGDAAFQAKCLQRINELREAGTTIVFISHDLGAVERTCDRVLLLHAGEVIADAPPAVAIEEYQTRLSRSLPSATVSKLSKEAEITSVEVFSSEVEPGPNFRTGGPITIKVGYVVHQTISNAVFEAFFLKSDEGHFRLECHLTTALSQKRCDLRPGEGTIEFVCDELGLQPGLYALDLTIIQRGQALGAAIDHRERCASIRVDPGKAVRGRFYMPYRWQLSASPAIDISQTEKADTNDSHRDVILANL